MERGLTDRARIGERDRRRIGGSPLKNHPRHLRDHVAAALNLDRITDADVLARKFVGVVQRRPAHGHATDGHGFEMRHGRHGTGPTDLQVDGVQRRRRRSRGEFVGDHVSRAFRRRTQFVVLAQAVHLHHRAVDLVRQLVAPRFPLATEIEHGVDIDAEPAIRFRLETPASEHFQRIPLRADLARSARHPVRHERERPASHFGVVLQFERPGGEVAGVCIELFAGGLATIVEFTE